MIKEEVDVAQNVYRGRIDIGLDDVRDNINTLIAGVTAKPFITPYIAFERVRKTLAYYHIYTPGVMFLSGDHGVKSFPANQFDNISGMNDQGKLVSKEDSPYSIFFEWCRNDDGMFDVFCEIVDEEDLQQLLSDVAKEQTTPSDKRRDKLNEGNNDNRKDGEDPIEGAMRAVDAMTDMTKVRKARLIDPKRVAEQRPKGPANSNRPKPKRLAESTLRKLEEARANKHQEE